MSGRVLTDSYVVNDSGEVDPEILLTIIIGNRIQYRLQNPTATSEQHRQGVERLTRLDVDRLVSTDQRYQRHLAVIREYEQSARNVEAQREEFRRNEPGAALYVDVSDDSGSDVELRVNLVEARPATERPVRRQSALFGA